VPLGKLVVPTGDEMGGARDLPSPRARPRRSPASGLARTNGGAWGHEHVLEIQRRRLLAAASLEVAEHGVAGLTISNVLRCAGMSRRTYYEIYADRDECLLDVMQDTLERVAAPVRAAWQAERQWLARVRAAVAELLWQLQQDPVAARLLVIEAQSAGRPTLELRAQTLAAMATALDEGRAQSRTRTRLAAATAEGLVGGALSVLQTRLLSEPAPDVLGLAGSLVSMLVLPYLGAAAAQRELERALPEREELGAHGGSGAREDQPLPMRVTHRTARTLAAIQARPGSNNRAVGTAAGIVDQGQISKLLRRLERIGLVENVGGGGKGAPNAWRLTMRGETVMRLMQGAGAASPPAQDLSS
jgi:AcrR family transcriptional regulator